jgi:hypothetical protein
MQIYDPTVAGPERHSVRAAALTSLDGKTIGILENGKINAVNLLRETAVIFGARNGCTVVPIFSKTNASAPAPAETLAEASAKVDFLITGLGD